MEIKCDVCETQMEFRGARLLVPCRIADKNAVAGRYREFNICINCNNTLMRSFASFFRNEPASDPNMVFHSPPNEMSEMDIHFLAGYLWPEIRRCLAISAIGEQE